MLRQLIKLIRFETEQDNIVPRFYPLVNQSQFKELEEKYEKDDKFRTLEWMNEAGWKLESIQLIFDDKLISHQIAIFTFIETK